MTVQIQNSPAPGLTCAGKAQCTDCEIRKMAMCSGLSGHELEPLLHGVDIIQVEPQSHVYQEGDKAGFVFTVRSGVVKLTKELPNGDVRIVRLSSRGDTIGLEVMLGGPYNHTATALTEVELCRVPLGVMNALNEQVPSFHHQLMARWQMNVDVAESFITDLSTGHAKARLAHLLLNYFSDGLSGVWNHPARDDIAHMLGITLETASRIMAEFKREGLISEVSGRIVIHDPVALKAIAED